MKVAHRRLEPGEWHFPHAVVGSGPERAGYLPRLIDRRRAPRSALRPWRSGRWPSGMGRRSRTRPPAALGGRTHWPGHRFPHDRYARASRLRRRHRCRRAPSGPPACSPPASRFSSCSMPWSPAGGLKPWQERRRSSHGASLEGRWCRRRRGTSTDRSFGHDPVDIRLALASLPVHSGLRWSGS